METSSLFFESGSWVGRRLYHQDGKAQESRSKGGKIVRSFRVFWMALGVLTPGLLSQEGADIGTALMEDPSVKAALDAAQRFEPQTLEDQIRLCEIPAPPFQEGRRAEALRRTFEESGLENVRID